jgi:undecaprenyl-diphosphatase
LTNINNEKKNSYLKMLLIKIQDIDTAIAHFLKNTTWLSNLRPIMKFFSHPPYWRQILTISILTILIFTSNRGRWRIFYLLILILISDQTCNIIKALVKRVRPDGLRNTKGSIWQKIGYYSFPSSHAANTFAAATLLLWWWPFLAIPLYILATLISFSRIYLNNHYFSDVLVGGCIGLIYGFLIIRFLNIISV